jgi:hypothetical protein
MAIYLWQNPSSPSGRSILIRTAFGNGIAVSNQCCCRACCCDDLPDTLYAKIYHTVSVEGGGVTNRYTYFTLTHTVTPDGCACTLPAEAECNPKGWHGIFTRTVWGYNGSGYELRECNVHVILACYVGIGKQLSFVVGGDFYTCGTDLTSGYCNSSGAMPVDCPLPDPFYLDPEVVNILDMWIQTTPWT